MNTLSEAELEAIEQEDAQTLAEWWVWLNHGYSYTCDKNRAWAAMSAIVDEIGLKACLREWNRSEDLLTGDDFELWWDGVAGQQLRAVLDAR